MKTIESGRVIAHPVFTAQTVPALKGINDPVHREGRPSLAFPEHHPPAMVRDGRVWDHAGSGQIDRGAAVGSRVALAKRKACRSACCQGSPQRSVVENVAGLLVSAD